MYMQTLQQAIKMLENLSKILDKGIKYAETRKFDPANLFGARLAPDQFHLARQVQVCCDISKNAAARLAGKEPPRFEDNEATMDELKQRIAKTVEYLRTFQESDFQGADSRQIKLPFAEGQYILGSDFVHEFVLPNLYFHATTAYAILRHNGVELGKGDFLGSLNFKPL